ncbi:MAG: type II toxin-antitoxin system HicA family toxin [Bacteroidetes bacterium]|nr:type II toxin-antitoxin system HicA family toxin [Bacteroidota bacterium]
MIIGRKRRKTLVRIFEDPIRADIEWSSIVKMLVALGAERSEGRGSRVRIHLPGVRAVFHRPPPKKEIDKGALRSMRIFLSRAGIKS